MLCLRQLGEGGCAFSRHGNPERVTDAHLRLSWKPVGVLCSLCGERVDVGTRGVDGGGKRGT